MGFIMNDLIKKRCVAPSTAHIPRSILDKTITLTNFDNFSGAGMTAASETIANFIERFATLAIKRHTLTFYNQQNSTDKAKLKNGGCLSLATFGKDKAGGKTYRNKDNVKSICGICIDIDNKLDSEDRIGFDFVDAKFPGVFKLIYTTHASSDEHLRLRVVMFFLEPINKERYDEVFAYCAEKLGTAVDARAKDVCRLSFYPSCPKDMADHYRYEVRGGKLFDISVVPTCPPKSKQPPKPKNHTANQASDCPSFKPVNLAKLKIPASLKTKIQGNWQADDFASRSEKVSAIVRRLHEAGISAHKIFCIVADSKYDVRDHYVSLDHIWEDVNRIIRKFQVNQYGLIHDLEPYYPRPQYQDPNEICKSLYQDIEHYLAEQELRCSSVLALKAPAGVGKTAEVINQVVKLTNNDGFVEVYLPSHKLAKQFKGRLRRHRDFSKAVKIMYGRESKYARPGHCLKKEAAGSLAKINVPVPNLLCQNKAGTVFCADYDNCGYRKQYKKTAAVVIYTHQHLFLKRNSDERQRKPDLIVIDESFWKASLHSTKIKLSAIASLSVPAAIKQALQSDDPYDYLSEHELDPQKMIAAKLLALRNKQKAIIAKITPQTLPDKTMTVGKKASQLNNSIKLLETLLADYQRMAYGKPPIFLYREIRKKRFDDADGKMVAWHCVEKRKKLERLHWTHSDQTQSLIPTVYIDADLEPDIAKLFFENVEFKAYYAKRRCRIWQTVTASHSNTELMKDDSALLKTVQKQLNHFSACFPAKSDKPNVLLITYKKLLDSNKLMIPDNVKPLYFGGYRGIDNLKHYDACIVIGRFQIPMDAIERYGIGLWHDSAQPLHFGSVTKLPVGYRLIGKKKMGVPVLFPTDERLQMLTRQVRECETLQGIDRLRLIHAEFNRPVLLLSSVPLDIDVHQLFFGKRSETKIDRILKQAPDNVISLHSKVLYRDYPDKFESEDDAKQTVQRWKKLYIGEDGCARIHGKKYQQTKYQCNKKGGRSPFCVHRAKTPKKVIIQSLQRIHGDECPIKLSP